MRFCSRAICKPTYHFYWIIEFELFSVHSLRVKFHHIIRCLSATNRQLIMNTKTISGKDFEVEPESKNKIVIHLQEGSAHLNKEAPNSFTVQVPEGIKLLEPKQYTDVSISEVQDISLTFSLEKNQKGGTILVKCAFYLCNDKDMCTMENVEFSFNVSPGKSKDVVQKIDYTLNIQ